MLAKRIIPCLDVKNGETVKGINFENLRYAGNPVALAKKYSEEGADELVFLDITATNEERKTTIEMVEKVAKKVFIPFTVGGGIKSLDDMKKLLLFWCGQRLYGAAAPDAHPRKRDTGSSSGPQRSRVKAETNKITRRKQPWI